ncbi:hypothetical protein N7451_006684 [Penicillium sp. IBT 35674x]|nr:hypothetical protein N7451_006684 [Penicillium sp. IBT 35674x]
MEGTKGEVTDGWKELEGKGRGEVEDGEEKSGAKEEEKTRERCPGEYERISVDGKPGEGSRTLVFYRFD